MTDATDADQRARRAEPALAADAARRAAAAASFADFDVHPDIVAALADARHHHPVPHPGDDPAGRPGRPRHHRPGQDRHRQDPRLRHPDAQPHRRARRRRARRLADAGKPQALAVAPTRELAVQVASDLERAGKRRGVRVLTVYGGRAYEPQIEALRKRRRGRRRHARAGSSTWPSRATSTCRTRKSVVLDEADEMLDLGFLPDVETLLALTPAGPPDHALLGDDAGRRRRAGPPLHDASRPTSARWATTEENAHTVKAVEQFVYRAHAMDKVEMLARMLQAEGRGLTIVFSRTKRTAAKVADDLDRARVRRRRHPRRPRPGRPRAGAARVPQRQGRHPRRHRRRRPRHRRRERHPRHQLPVPRGREDLPAPHRPHRPRRQHRHRGHLRRLGRPAPLGPDQQGARPRHPRARGDLLLVRPPLRPTSTSRAGAKGRLPKAAADAAPASAPRCSRTSARPASPAGVARAPVAAAGDGGSRDGGRGRDGGSRDGGRPRWSRRQPRRGPWRRAPHRERRHARWRRRGQAAPQPQPSPHPWRRPPARPPRPDARRQLQIES